MSMQYDEAMQLKKEHQAAGNPPCDHQWVKEYYLGSSTGDVACTVCGESKPKKS